MTAQPSGHSFVVVRACGKHARCAQHWICQSLPAELLLTVGALFYPPPKRPHGTELPPCDPVQVILDAHLPPNPASA